MCLIRKTALIIIVATLFFHSTGFMSNKLSGIWEGTSSVGELIKIEFNKNNTTRLYRSRGGIAAGKTIAAVFWPKYQLDLLSDPISLDLVYYTATGIKSHQELCILRHKDEKTIEIGLPKEVGKRPKSFYSTEVREIWTLSRNYRKEF